MDLLSHPSNKLFISMVIRRTKLVIEALPHFVFPRRIFLHPLSYDFLSDCPANIREYSIGRTSVVSNDARLKGSLKLNLLL